MRVVPDASVVLKWMLADSRRERDTELATALMQSALAGELEILLPFHWLAEVVGALARLSPATAVNDTMLLRALDLPTVDDIEVLSRACQIAIDSGQHVFDTLYHAVALESDDAILVTADERYRAKAQKLGCIVALQSWQPIH